MNILLFENEDLSEEGHLLINGYQSEHLSKILKVQIGDKIKVGQINDKIGNAEVINITDSEIKLNLLELNTVPEEPWIDLILALPRPQMCKRIFQNVSGLGVRSLDIINSSRVEKSFFSSPILKPAEIDKYLRLGLEQSALTHLTKVEIWPKQKDFFEQKLQVAKAEYDFSILADLDTNCVFSSKSMVERDSNIPKPFGVLAIGPEGGWVKSEADFFEKNGFQKYSFGEPIMKVETALVYILAQLRLLYV